jgi:hypothetical protein
MVGRTMTIEEAITMIGRLRDENRNLKTAAAVRRGQEEGPTHDFSTVMGVLDFLRAEKGMTSRELGQMLGLTSTESAGWFFKLKFTNATPIERLIRIADALEIPLSHVLEIWEEHRRLREADT